MKWCKILQIAILLAQVKQVFKVSWKIIYFSLVFHFMTMTISLVLQAIMKNDDHPFL